ncbi:MAG: hypothetical protein ACO1SV_24480 [Fimbriimonas sp.]
MNLKILAAAALATAMLLPAIADAQSRKRGNGRPGGYDRPYGNHRPDRGWRNYDYRPGRVRQYYNSGWGYGYPRDYRWPYGRSYDLGTGRLWTPRGADVYYLPNGVRVYLPR